ncbi:MAG: hypothetical protein IT341_10575 [Chloroflexi bacterium]|nr:hypothetical protein [Chloroflexota bacterium]
MARKPSARVVMNRAALDEVRLAVADGALAVGEAVVREADPPDATPFGAGLVTNGGWIGYVGDKKIGGGGLDGKQPKKPRTFRVRGTQRIQIIAGFGFPGRFQELGTVNHPAQPFFTPAMNRVLPRTSELMRPATQARLRRIA